MNKNCDAFKNTQSQNRQMWTEKLVFFVKKRQNSKKKENFTNLFHFHKDLSKMFYLRKKIRIGIRLLDWIYNRQLIILKLNSVRINLG